MMATRPLTMLIWVAVCVTLSLSHANAKPKPNSDDDDLSDESIDGFRSRNNEALQLFRKMGLLEGENIDSDGESDKENERNRFDEKLLHAFSTQETNKDKFKKRACNWNLGGHCATENAVQMADQWNYLKSAMSPGRRRRRRSVLSSSASASSSSVSSASYSADRGHLDGRRDQLLSEPNQRP